MLAHDGEVVKALRGCAGERIFAKVLVGRVFLNAGDEAGTDATAKHELLVAGDLVVEPQRVNLRFLGDGEVADQTIEWSERGRCRDTGGDEAVGTDCWLQEGGILARCSERRA